MKKRLIKVCPNCDNDSYVYGAKGFKCASCSDIFTEPKDKSIDITKYLKNKSTINFYTSKEYITVDSLSVWLIKHKGMKILEKASMGVHTDAINLRIFTFLNTKSDNSMLMLTKRGMDYLDNLEALEDVRKILDKTINVDMSYFMPTIAMPISFYIDYYKDFEKAVRNIAKDNPNDAEIKILLETIDDYNEHLEDG